jgi:PhnB protein
LNFDGNCREAMAFYARGLGLDLQTTPFSDMPGDRPKEVNDRIMHARLTKGTAVFLMASDTMPECRFIKATALR